MRQTCMIAATLATLTVAGAYAQKPTPTPQMDSRGLPLPYGVQPYFKPDVPLGSGPYKAIMAVEPSLPSQVAYYPANLSQLRGRRMPVVIWGGMSIPQAVSGPRRHPGGNGRPSGPASSRPQAMGMPVIPNCPRM